MCVKDTVQVKMEMTLHSEGIVITEIKITSESEGDYFSKNDLFAKVTVGGQTKRTSTAWDQNICTWSESIYFPINNRIEEWGETVTVEIMDEDIWGPDEIINSIKFDIKETDKVVRKQGVQIKLSFVSLVDSKEFIATKEETVKQMEELDLALALQREKIQRLENSIIQIKDIVSQRLGESQCLVTRST